MQAEVEWRLKVEENLKKTERIFFLIFRKKNILGTGQKFNGHLKFEKIKP